MTLLRSLTLSYRLFLLIAIFAAGFIVYGSWSLRTLDQLKVNGPLYGEIMASKDVIADALPPPLFIIESYLACLQMTAPQADAQRIAALEMRLGQLREQHEARKRHWSAQRRDAALAQLMKAVEQPAASFYEQAYAQMIPALHRGDRAGVASALAGMAAAYEQHRAAVDALVGRAAGMAASAEVAAAQRIADQTARLRLILFAALGLAIAAAVLIRRSITVPLKEALELARRVAGGDMCAHGHARYPDEPGQLLDALDTMSASLAAMLAERDSAARSLRSAKELTERLIDSANLIVVGLDRGGRVQLFNRTASLVTGYAAPAVMHQVWRTLPLFDAADASHWPADDGWDAVRLVDEQQITTAAGARRCIAWQTTVLGEQGGEIALMSFGVDVTEQRAALDATVKAQEMAEAATRSKSEFLATMSHEIRTPMNAVIGMTRLALNTELDARQRNYLEKADRAAHGLLGIINDILDFSKIEAGKLRFEQRPMALRQTLDHLAAMTVFRAQEKGLELLFDVAPDVPLEMTGDPLRLGQVLLNLVNNAIKFTERGEIIVAIHTLDSADGQVHLQFEVRDTGIGITPEQATRLFSAFSQADASTTRTHGGTGLGLAISRKLVEMMDGRLWLDSAHCGGSRFCFSARFGRHAHMAPAPAPARELAALKVLVVDDNAAAREIMQGILQSMQMRAVSALSAQGAIAELESAERGGDPYQLVLMDWMMPTMDGLAAIRAIRANPAISNTLAIIMVTAYSREDLLEQAADLPRLGVLDKPVTPSSVLDAIASGLYQDSAPLPRALPQKRLAAALHALRGATVLLVEDNEVNQELAVDILTGLGMKVQVAGNGKIALEMVEREPFDVVLMDCQMPVMDGFEATRRLRAQARFASLPVLAMTANAMSGDRERCLEAGMNEHISKPINQEALAITLAQWLAPPAGQAQPADDFSALRGAGVDVDAGLARLHGNDIAYARLVAQLSDGFEDKLRAALADGADERARRLAHHLAGLAANVGAFALADAAARLERALEARSGIADALAALTPVLMQVQHALTDR